MPDRDLAGDETESRDREPTVPGFGPPTDSMLPVVTESDRPKRPSLRNIVVVLGSAALVVIVVVVILAWLFLSAIRGAVDDVESQRDETAITARQYQDTKLGMTETELRDRLGEPTKVTDSANGNQGSGAERKCLYYNERDAGLVAGTQFEFCFAGEQLIRKSKY